MLLLLGDQVHTDRIANRTVVLAASPIVDGLGGRYFEDCNEAGPHQPGTYMGVAAYALDPAVAQRLWSVSLESIRDTA